MPERFDDDLRRIMDGYKAPFQGSHWASMERMLNRRKRRIYFFRSMAALFVLALTGTAAYWYFASSRGQLTGENNMVIRNGVNSELRLNLNPVIQDPEINSTEKSDNDLISPFNIEDDNEEFIVNRLEEEKKKEEFKEEIILREKHNLDPLESFGVVELEIAEEIIQPTDLNSKEFKFKPTGVQTTLSVGTAIGGNFNQLRPSFMGSLTIPVGRRVRIGGALGFVQLDYGSGPKPYSEVDMVVATPPPPPVPQVDLIIDMATVSLFAETNLLRTGKFRLSALTGLGTWVPLREEYRITYPGSPQTNPAPAGDPTSGNFVFSNFAQENDNATAKQQQWKWNPSWVVISAGLSGHYRLSSRLSAQLSLGGSLPMDDMGLNNERKPLLTTGLGLRYFH